MLRQKMKTADYPRVTREQKKLIKQYWKGYKVSYDYIALCNAQNPSKSGFDVRYIPYQLEYCFVDPYYSSEQAAQVLDDKNYYDMFFFDVPQPVTIARKVGGTFLSATFEPLTKEAVVDKIEIRGSCIMKVSIDSAGGFGCEVWKKGMSKEKVESLLDSEKNIVIQELIRQHDRIAQLHPESINTIRIMTIIRNGEVQILSTLLRMGVGSNCVDNASMGGIYCGIDATGRLKKYAYDRSGMRYEQHPTTNEAFEGYCIPGVEACQNLVKKIAWRFYRTTRLASWDFAIDTEGKPVLIEINMSYGGLDVHQPTNGPLYGDETRAIVDAVFEKKPIKRIIQKLF